MRTLVSLLSVIVFVSGAAIAQRGLAQPPIPLQISGQIRLDGRIAPQGVLVLLDVAPSRNVAPAGAGELARTMTDSSGRFFFDHVEAGRSSTKLYAVSVRFPGYKDNFQVVDLTFSPHGYVNLDLHRDTSKDIPNTPPPGAGNLISAKQPASPEAQHALAEGEKLLLEQHEPKQSIERFKKVVKLDPGYAPGYLLLGTALMQTQEWPDAQSAFEKAAKLEPTNAEAFIGIGAALNQQHDYSGAQKPLVHSLELKPDSAEANYELGRSLWALGKWKEAEPHARKAIELNKDFADAHVLMGNIYLRHRDANNALTEFRESLRLAPQGQFAEPVKEMIAKIEKALAEH